MKFYHFISPSTLQTLMQGKDVEPLPTICPTVNLILGGCLTLYYQHHTPVAFPLVQDRKKASSGLLLDFKEKKGTQTHFTLRLLGKAEPDPFKRGSLIFGLPKSWPVRPNSPFTGGTLALGIGDLVTLLKNNLMQVINPQSPHNALLYPDGNAEHKAAKNIHAYASIYLKGYQKRLNQVLHNPPRTLLSLMDAKTLANCRQEPAQVLALKKITDHLGKLVGFYQKNQAPPDLEQFLVEMVLALSPDRLKDSYL